MLQQDTQHIGLSGRVKASAGRNILALLRGGRSVKVVKPLSPTYRFDRGYNPRLVSDANIKHARAVSSL